MRRKSKLAPKALAAKASATEHIVVKFNTTDAAPSNFKCDCVVAGIFAGGLMPTATTQLNRASDGRLRELVRMGDLNGEAGTSLLIHRLSGVTSPRVLVVGLGKQEKFDERAYQNALIYAMQQIKKTNARSVTSFLTELPVGSNVEWRLRMAALYSGQTCYRFNAPKLRGSPPESIEEIFFSGPSNSSARAALNQAQAILAGMQSARDLGNLPPNVCTPAYIAERARALSRRHPVRVTVLERADMEKLGMGALLSVAVGAERPPKLIAMEYRGGRTGARPVVLVGKGVTFDSGGISIKPSADMDEMKYDMSGAGSVLGAMEATLKLKLPINLVALIPATENMPDGRATRPGDVVRSMSGQTIEVINTDAEGRMILCDTLTYAARYNPACVVDVATLTGACVVALGKVASGLFSNNDKLSQELLRASRSSLDYVWPLPVWDHYQELIDTNFADMANSGGRYGGAITGACFLSRFTQNYEWAHLDIAGTAWVSGHEKNSTGRPVPLLVHFLLARAGQL